MLGGAQALLAMIANNPGLSALAELHRNNDSAEACHGLLEKLLYQGFKKKFQIRTIETAIYSSEPIYWLNFTISGKRFALGSLNIWSDRFDLLSLLQWVKAFNSNQASDCGQLLIAGQVDDFESSSKIFSFEATSLESRSPFFLKLEESCQLPFFYSSSIASLAVKLWIYLDVENLPSTGSCSFSACRIRFDGSEIFSHSASILVADLLANLKQQNLTLGELSMNHKGNLKTSIRLGALEFRVDDLLSLRAGSEVKFTMPARSYVELELAGHIVGRGELSVENERFVLRISESPAGV